MTESSACAGAPPSDSVAIDASSGSGAAVAAAASVTCSAVATIDGEETAGDLRDLRARLEGRGASSLAELAKPASAGEIR